MGMLRADYEALNQAARQIAQCAERIAECIRVLNAKTAELMAGWEGVAEQEFMQQLASCNARLAKSPALLTELASDVQQSAAVLIEGERQASQHILAAVTADDR
jgi:WXG100 family type VII secretion target